MPERGRGLSREERQKLLAENLPGVRYIARRIHLRLPPHVPFDDLVHSGVLGLMDALDKFDPRRNVPLKSYARFRIRGAILDSLRQLDWSPRDLRRKSRQIEQVREELTHKLGRPPSELETAADMGLPLDEFQEIVAELDGLRLGAQLGEADENHAAAPSELCTTEEDPFHHFVLNICESRVSQIVTAATTQLRSCLRGRLQRKHN